MPASGERRTASEEHMSAETLSKVPNRLLATLAPDDLARLHPYLERVTLTARQTLLKPSNPVDYVYFPVTGMVSLVQLLQDGSMIEAGLIGKEGLVGLSAVLGTKRTSTEALVQVAGAALRIRAAVLQHEIDQNRRLLALLLRYAQALLMQVSQLVACAGRHSVEERLARWLLAAQDAAEGNEVTLNHEFLALMLARRRPGVTVAAGALAKAGLISRSHGRIRILDRPGLETIACECYRAVKEEYDLLLPQ